MGKLKTVDLAALIRRGEPTTVADGDGLSFSLSVKGTAAWILRYRYAGRARELTLGRYPTLGLAEARDAARRARVVLHEGKDPGLIKQQWQERQFQQLSVAELFADFMARRGKDLRPATRRAHNYGFNKDVRSQIGAQLVSDVTPAVIVQIVRKVADRSYSSAKRLWENLSVLFAHAVAISLISRSPLADLRPSAILGKAPPRRPRVTLDLMTLTSMCGQLGRLGDTNRLAILVLLATCVRKSELLEAEWSEFDLQYGLWTIPGSRTGNKAIREYSVPLAPIVVAWLKELRLLAGNSAKVLPPQASNSRGQQINMSRTTLNNALKRLEGGLVRISPHTLRRSARSFLRMIGAPDDAIERSLNHSLGGMRDPYQDDLLIERRIYLGYWAQLMSEAEIGSANNSDVLPRAIREAIQQTGRFDRSPAVLRRIELGMPLVAPKCEILQVGENLEPEKTVV